MKKTLITVAIAASAALTMLAGAASAHPGPHGGGFHGGGFHGGGFHGGGFHGGFHGIGYGHGGGFRHWSRGGFWPRGYGVVIVDPVVYGLYAAPYGRHWVRDEYGQLVLIDEGSGEIVDVVVR
jgi:Ni/Co efflux regulator RcnB